MGLDEWEETRGDGVRDVKMVNLKEKRLGLRLGFPSYLDTM